MIPRSSLSLLFCMFLLLFSECQEKKTQDSGTPVNIKKSNDSAITDHLPFDTSSDSLIDEIKDFTNASALNISGSRPS